MHFASGELPPVNAFWSLTMYELPQSLLVANPINRYLLNSPMLPQFVKDADGGLTLYVQNELPGKDKEPNWLPAPKGPFLDCNAPLLAEGGGDRRHMEASADDEGTVTDRSSFRTPCQQMWAMRCDDMVIAPHSGNHAPGELDPANGPLWVGRPVRAQRALATCIGGVAGNVLSVRKSRSVLRGAVMLRPDNRR